MASVKDGPDGIRENVQLKNFTTYKIGGPAKYFIEAKTKEDIMQTVLWAKKINLPFFILGSGSNLLVSDNGFEGLVIKIQNSKYEIPRTRTSSVRGRQNTKIFANAGAPLALIVNTAAEAGLAGLEWAAGIPGTIGGAIYGGVGMPDLGQSMKAVVENVEALDANNLMIKNFSNKECDFAYRESIFKKHKNLIILSATIKLKKENSEKIKKKIKEFILIRQAKQPLDLPSAGSVFKNPQGFYAGDLIEKCGLKETKIGSAQISRKHANFILNLGGATAEDIKSLIELAKKEVKNKFGIELNEEIQYLGF